MVTSSSMGPLLKGSLDRREEGGTPFFISTLRRPRLASFILGSVSGSGLGNNLEIALSLRPKGPPYRVSLITEPVIIAHMGITVKCMLVTANIF